MTPARALPSLPSLPALPALALLAVALLAGCETPPVWSELAGDWQGKALARSTQHKESIVEDYRVTIGPTGRLERIGLMSFDRIRQAGQTLTDGPATIHVLRADYQPTRSEFAYESRLAGRPAARSGVAWSAQLLPDGRLDAWLFTYELAGENVRGSESVLVRALLQRAATTRGEGE